MPIPGVVGSDYAVTPCRVKHFRDTIYAYGLASSTTSPKNITGLNWLTGDTIIVVVSAPPISGLTFSLPTNANLTFSSIQFFNDGLNGCVGSWSAVAGTDQTNQTIAVARSGGTSGYNVFAYIISGAASVVGRGAGLSAFNSVAVNGGSLMLYSIGDGSGGGIYTVRAGSGIYTKHIEYGDGVATGYQVSDYLGVSQGTYDFGYSGTTLGQQLIEVTSAKVAPAVPAIPRFKYDLGWGRSSASSTSVAITLTSPVSVGDLIVVRVACDNLATTGPTITCNDTPGNTYTQYQLASANVSVAANGIVGCIFASKATFPMVVGNQITVFFSSAIVAKAVYAESFVGINNSVRAASTAATGSGTGPSCGAGMGSVNDLVLGYCAAETITLPTTISTSSISGAFSSLNLANASHTGTDTSLVQVMGQHKIISGSSAAPTFGWTLGASTDWVCSGLVLAAG